MADVIEFEKRFQNLKSVRDSSLRQRKLDALRKIFQCTRCMLKCAKCGAQLDSQGEESSRYGSPYRFCSNCFEEYEEYRERVNNSHFRPKFYWHNEAWMRVWKTWLEHQDSLNQYRQSKEFLQLLEEADELIRQ